MNESELNRIEKQLNPRPEVKEWIPLFQRDGKYYRHSTDKTPMTDSEYLELHNAPEIGLIIVNYVDRPRPDENKEDKDD